MSFLRRSAVFILTFHVVAVIAYHCSTAVRGLWFFRPVASYVLFIHHNHSYGMFKKAERPQSQAYSLVAQDQRGETKRFGAHLPELTELRVGSFRTGKTFAMFFTPENRHNLFLQNYARRACAEIRSRTDFVPTVVFVERQITRQDPWTTTPEEAHRTFSSRAERCD